MSREEAIKILMLIQAGYPNFKVADKTATATLWQMMFADTDYNLVSAALQAYIVSDTSGFAPTVGQLTQYVRKIQNGTQEQLGEVEAWSLVSKALRNSTYNSQAEFDKLPEDIQKAVGSPTMLRQWAVDENFNESVVSSNFMRAYKVVTKRREEYEALPVNVQNLMALADKERKVLAVSGE